MSSFPADCGQSPSVDSSAGVRLIAGEDVDAPDPVRCRGPPLRAALPNDPILPKNSSGCPKTYLIKIKERRSSFYCF